MENVLLGVGLALNMLYLIFSICAYANSEDEVKQAYYVLLPYWFFEYAKQDTGARKWCLYGKIVIVLMAICYGGYYLIISQPHI